LNSKFGWLAAALAPCIAGEPANCEPLEYFFADAEGVLDVKISEGEGPTCLLPEYLISLWEKKLLVFSFCCWRHAKRDFVGKHPAYRCTA